jgi:AhpD family alkylhydroperoxidase
MTITDAATCSWRTSRHGRCHKDRAAGIWCSFTAAARDTTSEDEVMEPRFTMVDNEIGAKFSKRFGNASLVIIQSTLPKTTQELVMLRVSQINGCGWCVDIHTKDAAAAGETAVRLHLVAAWRESTVFTEAEQAALALAEEGTRLADASHGVSDETWAEARKHYDDDQIAALVALVAQINAANRLSVIVRLRGGSYEPGMFGGTSN